MALVSEDSAGEIVIALSLSTNKFNHKKRKSMVLSFFNAFESSKRRCMSSASKASRENRERKTLFSSDETASFD